MDDTFFGAVGGGFHKSTPKWMVYFMEKQRKIWMRTWGTFFASGNLHMNPYDTYASIRKGVHCCLKAITKSIINFTIIYIYICLDMFRSSGRDSPYQPFKLIETT
jgi:hypothetical protein